MDRIELINFIISSEKLKSYLEIGCSYDECFKSISAPIKVGVDPVKGGTVRMDSDSFFKKNKDLFDIVFIDGLHHCDQVVRDICNSLNSLNENGFIVIHDCHPSTEREQQVPYPENQNIWNGDVWKSLVYFREVENIEIIVGNFDYGCGIIKKTSNKRYSVPNNLELERYIKLDWEYFCKNKKEILNLVNFSYIKDWI